MADSCVADIPVIEMRSITDNVPVAEVNEFSHAVRFPKLLFFITSSFTVTEERFLDV